jgi:holo-[acyl-carrier protein] synthase
MSDVLHGVDIVEIARIESMLQAHGERFLDRVFTMAERAYAEASVPGRAERYAARFAAKEAVFKALACGWSGGTAWTDVGVTHREGGAPIVTLQGQTAVLAAQRRVSQWSISLSHAGGMAMASVIGTVEDG